MDYIVISVALIGFYGIFAICSSNLYFPYKKYLRKFFIEEVKEIEEKSEDTSEQDDSNYFGCNKEFFRTFNAHELVFKVNQSLKYLNSVPYLPIAQEHPYFLEAQKVNHWKSLKFDDFNIIANEEIGIAYCVDGIAVFYIFNKVFRCSGIVFFEFMNKVT